MNAPEKKMMKTCITTWTQNVYGNAKVKKRKLGKGQTRGKQLQQYSCTNCINNYGHN
jgi:hypothetical protein